MSTEALHLMTIPELIHERTLTERRVKNITGRLSHCSKQLVFDLEEALKEGRDYIEIINARIARLERAARN